MPEIKEVIKKICLLGDPAVGKTSLIRRYVFDQFDDKYIMTIGTKVTKKSVSIPKPELNQEFKLTMLIWDILGQKEYSRLHPVYYQGAEGALIVCDYTRRETLDSLPEWASSFMKVVGDVPIMFLVNKSDLVEKAAFSEKDVQEASNVFGNTYLMTSAKTGLNVESSFKAIGESLVNAFLAKQQDKVTR